jgi:hypothetical protein
VVVEYPDGTTYTEINWTAWDRGYNGGDDGARCGGHIWWYDYTTANPFYMPSRTSTACLHASGKAVFFWAR